METARVTLWLLLPLELPEPAPEPATTPLEPGTPLTLVRGDDIGKPKEGPSAGDAVTEVDARWCAECPAECGLCDRDWCALCTRDPERLGRSNEAENCGRMLCCWIRLAEMALGRGDARRLDIGVAAGEGVDEETEATEGCCGVGASSVAAAAGVAGVWGARVLFWRNRAEPEPGAETGAAALDVRGVRGESAGEGCAEAPACCAAACGADRGFLASGVLVDVTTALGVRCTCDAPLSAAVRTAAGRGRAAAAAGTSEAICVGAAASAPAFCVLPSVSACSTVV